MAARAVAAIDLTRSSVAKTARRRAVDTSDARCIESTEPFARSL